MTAAAAPTDAKVSATAINLTGTIESSSLVL